MKYALDRFMSGRYGQYGVDGFGWFLFVIGLILSGAPFLWVLTPLLGGWEMYRLLSRNLAARSSENREFRQIAGKLTGWMSPVLVPLKRAAGFAAVKLVGWGFKGVASGRKTLSGGKRFVAQNRTRFEERKISLFVRCKQCNKLLRLPRGKGRMEVTCPVCRNVFVQKT